MLSIKIVCVGKLKERFYVDAADEYIKRLSAYCKTEIIEIPEHKLPPDNAQQTYVDLTLEKQRAAIERAAGTRTNSRTIALCVEGRQINSEELSEFLSNCAVQGVSSLCFLVGGSFGLHDAIKDTADVKLSLSKLTFPHNLARVILLEQLYRAFNISEGGKYHK